MPGQINGIRYRCRRSRCRRSRFVSDMTVGMPDSSTRLAWMRLRSGSAACHDVRMIKRYFDCVAWCYRFRVSICQRLTATARGVLPFAYSDRHHRSFTGWTKLGQFDRILKKSKLRLASSRCFPYISFLRKGTAERSDAVIGMSSNGRTADSGSVNGGSTPSIPAIAFATYGPFV